MIWTVNQWSLRSLLPVWRWSRVEQGGAGKLSCINNSHNCVSVLRREQQSGWVWGERGRHQQLTWESEGETVLTLTLYYWYCSTAVYTTDFVMSDVTAADYWYLWVDELWCHQWHQSGVCVSRLCWTCSLCSVSQAASYLQVRNHNVSSDFWSVSSLFCSQTCLFLSVPSRSSTLSVTTTNCRPTPTTCCQRSTRWLGPSHVHHLLCSLICFNR